MGDRLIYNAIACRWCGNIIESTHRHDFKWCLCGKVAVDGGLDYARRLGNYEDGTWDYIDLAEWGDNDNSRGV